MLSAQGTQTVSWITEGLIGILDMSRLNFPNHAQCSGNQNLFLQKALLGIGRTSRLNFPILSSNIVVMDSKECSYGTNKKNSCGIM